MNKFISGTVAALALFAVAPYSQAVELLVSPGFEVPQVGEFPGWNLSTSVTGSESFNLNSAGLAGSGHDGTTNSLILRPWVGNGALGPNEGNFLNDNLPGGDVNGLDFLHYQTDPVNNGPSDPNIDAIAIFDANYGRIGGLKTNATLSQTQPVSELTEYTFSAFARWEDNYAGGAGTLDPNSPLGAVATPTTNTLRLEFLDAGNNVLATHDYDLLNDGGQFNDAFIWLQHSITETSPAGTARARVSADAKNMVFNTDPLQAAFYDSFSLMDTGDPNTELLENAGVDEGSPSALEFWDIFEIPEGCCGGDVLRSNIGQLFAAKSGSRGVWLSPFFGAHTFFEDVPVTGLMSQTVQVVGGGTYNFSGWAKFEQNFSGGVDTIAPGDPNTVFFAGQPSPTETLIALEFLDSGGNVINPIIDFDPNGASVIDPNSPLIIDIRAERQAQCAGNANDESCGSTGANGSAGWTQHLLSGVIAPANAVEARLTAGMLNGVFNTDPRQSAFFDDFSLDGPAPLVGVSSTVPEPTTLLSLTIGAAMLGLRRRRRT